jgi:general L-amino acid transport system substrate-binding protein
MKHSKLMKLLAVLFAFVLIAAACGGDDDAEPVASDDSAADDSGSDDSGSDDSVTLTQGGRLAAVIERGTLNCGVNDTLPGFGSVNADGINVGFDVDFCKVVAAAVLGDSEAVDYTALDSGQRFPALQSGEIDMLVRNTTWTSSRDGGEQANFMFTTFYDGQGFMVRADSPIESIQDMQNATICVLQSTTTLLNLNAIFGDQGISFTPVEFTSNDELQPAFVAESCEVWTTDASGLASFAAVLDVDTRILGDIISKEPLGPVVADGDTEWAQVVNWAVMATVQAEEFGINSANLSEFLDSDSTNIRIFLGLPIEVKDDDGNVTGEAIKEVGLGLPTDFAQNIISQVGNYGEIYDRHLTPLSLARGPNALWTDGGLMYVPPFR